ncbi:MAG: linear amide C-N hydrolase [Bacilli bacterium]|nr:linear amide C-N hydrolase [Bacilli bacterium]
MKKYLFPFLTLMPMMAGLASCSNKSNIKVHELQPFLFKTDVYKEMDHKFADEYYKKTYDNWEGGCTAVSKMIGDHRIVGRNMDLNISNKCAYIIPAETGKYKTIGLAYSFRDISPDYEIVKKDGLTEEFGKLLPFMCDDVLNEEGLHIELNMRHGECWPNGDDKFACEHTNEDAERRVHMFELPRLVAENCRTVSDAITYMNSLDVFSQNKYWNYSFLISDSRSDSALVEFCMDQMLVFSESEIPFYNHFLKETGEDYEIKAIAQANFYVNYIPYKMQDTKTGIGRYQTIQDGIEAVNSKEDMFKLMDKISYSWVYADYDVCKNEHFDPRSEQIGEFKGATYDFMMNDELEPYIRKALNDYSEPIRKMDRQSKRDKNKYWESSFTEVIDCDAKSIFIRFYEDYDMVYNITFDGIEKVVYNA